MVRKALRSLLEQCHDMLSQAKLAELARVNRGQFSSWLGNGKNLAPDKIVALIQALVIWAEDAREGGGAACAARYPKLIEQIKAYPPYRAKEENSSPFAPLVTGHRGYVERDKEAQLRHLMGRSPFQIAVIGGPKMGKSSLLNWAEGVLSPKQRVLRLECRPQLADPLSAIERAAKAARAGAAHGRIERLRDWAAWPDWVRRNLLTDGRPATLVLDHLEALAQAQLNPLQDAIHHLANQRRAEPALDQFNLIIAYDEARLATPPESQYISSGMLRDFTSLTLGCFNKGEVERLMQKLLVLDEDAPEVDDLASAAWDYFRGHPFLTHLWAHYQGEASALDPATIPPAMPEVADTSLLRPYWDGLEAETKAVIGRAIHAQPPSMIAIPAPTRREAAVWLADSGFFVAGDGASQGVLNFATPWIQERFSHIVRSEA